MKVQEVSLVDVAANLRKWILLKRAEMTTKADGAEPAGDETKKQEAIALPGQVKANLTGTLADMLELAGALAEMVGAATIDDAAQVPPTVPEMLTQIAQMATAAAEQLAAPPPESAPPQVPEAAPPAATMPEEPMAASKDAEGDVAKQDEGLAEQAAKALEQAHGIIAKAGRKMAARRLREMKAHVEGLVKLLQELGEADGVQKAASDTDAIAELTAALAGVTAKIDALGGELKLELAAVKKAVSEDAAKAAAIKKATTEQIDGIARALKGPAPSNLGNDPGGRPAPQRRPLSQVQDMAAEVQKRRQQR